MAELSPHDRDLMIRTVIGEVDPQDGDPGRAAVAHVILNRLSAGRFGKSAADVVLAKHQFEPWAARPTELMSYAPTSPTYQKAAKIVDAVMAGDVPDPTGGATHFYGPVAQRALGRQPPSWAKGEPLAVIGGHTFYAPEGRAHSETALGAIDKAIGAPPTVADAVGKILALQPEEENGGAASPVPSGSLFKAAGFDVPIAAPAATEAPASAAAASAPEGGSLFKAAGFALPGEAKGPAAGPNGMVSEPAPNVPTFERSAQSNYVDGEKRGSPPVGPITQFLDNLVEKTDPLNVFPVRDVPGAVVDAAKAGNALASSGIQDIRSGVNLPTMPSLDPTTWGAGGLLKTAAGGVGMLASPLTGATNALIEGPATKLTGNPEFGKTAGFLANTLVPGGGGAVATKAALPSSRAVNALVHAIGPENVPAVAARLSENPRLSVMDVSDPVRTMAQGLIDPAQPKTQTLLSDVVKKRINEAPAATNAAFTEAMGPAPDVVKMVEGLKDRTKEIGKTMIEPAIENAQPIPIKPLLKILDKQIGSPEAIRGEAPRIPLDPTQIKLLNLRKQITDGEQAPLGERVGLSVGPINDAIKTGGMSQSRLEDFTEARRLLNSARRGFTSEEDLVAGLKKLADKQKTIGPIDAALKMVTKGPVEYRGADFMHGIQSRLRETAEGLRSSSVGSERNMSGDLFGARDTLVNAIDKAASGSYRPALSKYRDAAQIHEAFDSGFDTLKNRSGVNGLEDRPEALREWMKTATPEQVVAKRLGTRADIDQKIRGVKNQALAGETITRIEYNRDKLKTLFGDKEASKLIRAMDDARDMATTNAKLLAGSKTAETQAGQRALELRKVGGGNPLQYALPVAAEMLGQGAGLPGVGGAAVTALGLAHRGLQKIGQKSDVARNLEFARAASASGPAREETINRLLSHPKVVRQLKKAGNALSIP